ncbi:MAG TPA: PIG-L family deacetylase [Bryobacteraceae bacterium]|nr:PIG-L family deacetylase [Bryobacteraceae bacterium]
MKRYSISVALNILAIHAHPDDIEIVAGGTVLSLIERGHRVTIATMTAGDCGTAEYSPDEIARIRRAEAAEAARLAGADYLCAEFMDLAVFSDDESRRRVTDVLRRTQPDVVLTASPVDYHCDHEATSALVRDACFGAPAPNYRTGGDAPPLKAIPHLYFCDPDEGLDREGNEVRPQFVVNVERHVERKAEMLACHASQRNWLKKHHGMDNYIDTLYEWTRNRGKLAGLQWGEGFRQYLCHPYPRTPLLQELLGDQVAKL